MNITSAYFDSSLAGYQNLKVSRMLRASALFFAFLVLTISFQAEAAPKQQPTSAEILEHGRRIYNEGILPSGKKLTATRFGTLEVSGLQAACVNCHRPSGMGSVEGDLQVPPITGNYLFGKGVEKNIATMDPKVSKKFNRAHKPYTDAELAYAITHGTNNSGHDMNELMPHYKLNKFEVNALIAYLKQLTVEWSPGISEDTIRLAMVITPEVDPARRKVLTDMMRAITLQKNGSTMTAKGSGSKRQHMVSAAEMILGTERNWDVDVWELQGLPESWGEQLKALYSKNPVFALVSGVTNTTWQPVHDFCEINKVPCWFPSVEIPPQQQSQYSIYFSRGVGLEADVLKLQLQKQTVPPKKVVQILRDEVVAQSAAKLLSTSLGGMNIAVENLILRTDLSSVDALRQALAKVNPNETVIFWLRPPDVASLVNFRPVSGVEYYFSSILSKADHGPFSTDWKQHAKLVYLYELPEQREHHLAYFHAWLNMKKLPLVDEVMQSEAFFALNYLSDNFSEMLGNMYRDYLIERAESMLVRREGYKSIQESKDRLMLGRPGEMTNKYGAPTLEARSRVKITGRQEIIGQSQTGTTIYPRLSLGPGQRYASKGGYIVRFADQRGNGLVAETEWLVP